MYFEVPELLSAAQEVEFDQERATHDFGPHARRQPGSGRRRTTCRNYVVEQQHALTGLHRVTVDLDLALAILEFVALGDRVPGQLPGLSRDLEAGAERERNRRAEDEAA